MKRTMIASLAVLGMIAAPALATTTTSAAKHGSKAQAKTVKASSKLASKSTKPATRTAKKPS